MPQQLESQTIICEGGLDNSENHLQLSDNREGTAARLVNFEVGEFGGYRRIEGFSLVNTAGNGNTALQNSTVGDTAITTDRPVLAVFRYRDLYDQSDYLIAARQVASQSYYSFYVMRDGNTWTLASDNVTLNSAAGQNYRPTATGVKRLHITKFNDGEGNKVCICDGVNNAVIFSSTASGYTWDTIADDGDPDNSSGNRAANGSGGDQAIDKPKCSAFAFKSLFLAGNEVTTLASSTIAYSSASTTTHGVRDFEAASGGGQVTSKFDVVQLMPFRDALYVFGKTGIQKITTTSAGVPSVIEDVTQRIGCAAPNSVVEVGGDLFFLSQDGIRPVAGTSRIGDVELETVSKPIQSSLMRLSSTYDLDNLVSLVIPSKQQLRYFLNVTSPTDSNQPVADSQGFIGGLRLKEGSMEWEWGELRGIRANCTDACFIGNTEYVYHGDHNGVLFRQEQGNSFTDVDGSAMNIVGLYSTPYLDMGDPLIRKTIRKVETFIRAEGSLTLGLSVDYDYGDPDLFRPSDLAVTTEGAITKFNRSEVVYDGATFLYGGQTKPVISYTLEGSGNSIQLRFVSDGQFAPFSIQGTIVKFTTSGKL